MKTLIVSLHDTHPGSLKLVQSQRNLLHQWGVAQCSILMVPQFHHGPTILESPETMAWGNEALARGDELVLHGYYHDRKSQIDHWSQWLWTRIYSNQEAEFFDLHQMKARERLGRGLSMFREIGWQPSGFIAPAWLMAEHLPETLRKMGFHYTNTVRGLIPLDPRPQWIPARSLCWSVRASWRRRVSLLWNEVLFRALERGSIMRLSLHPRDFDFAAIRQQIEGQVKRALDAGFEPVTYASYVAR